MGGDSGKRLDYRKASRSPPIRRGKPIEGALVGLIVERVLEAD